MSSFQDEMFLLTNIKISEQYAQSGNCYTCFFSLQHPNMFIVLPSKGHRPAVKPVDADHANRDGSAPSVTYCLKGLTTCLHHAFSVGTVGESAV